MSFQTRGDEKLFLAVYRLLRACSVLIHWGRVAWGQGYTAEADADREQQLFLVTQHTVDGYNDEG